MTVWRSWYLNQPFRPPELAMPLWVGALAMLLTGRDSRWCYEDCEHTHLVKRTSCSVRQLLSSGCCWCPDSQVELNLSAVKATTSQVRCLCDVSVCSVWDLGGGWWETRPTDWLHEVYSWERCPSAGPRAGRRILQVLVTDITIIGDRYYKYWWQWHGHHNISSLTSHSSSRHFLPTFRQLFANNIKT